MSRLDYLASKYLNAEGSASENKRKKRKRSRLETEGSIKSAGVTQGILVQEDDAQGWGNLENANTEQDDEILDGEDGPVTVDLGLSNEVSKKKAEWKKVGGSDKKEVKDHIQVSDNEKIEVEEQNEPTYRVGGLKTAAQVKAGLTKKMSAELEKLEQSSKSGKHKDVVYRDASGRRIDINAYKAKLRQEQLDEERKKEEAAKKEVELNKGLVQELQKKEEAQKLEDAATLSMHRHVDDEEYNRELKEESRWHDPAGAFVAKRKEAKTSATGLKIYQGAYPFNRFSIPPGHRWDGVDRSNGFEARVLEKRRSEKERKVEQDVYASNDDDD
ncbi:Pre-mRNA-splicing factor of RES complex-domain-containing protein [Lipomyces japonicus]|uniref:Pre-mRNA-splicing factor of RES complex-domain-containing protein n=1 Tax=Lipomyces japonicus TaxID=56871 RepID=UPI0034CEA08A